eukprot:15433661-Alexandrium_andersonii.AAC.1
MERSTAPAGRGRRATRVHAGGPAGWGASPCMYGSAEAAASRRTARTRPRSGQSSRGSHPQGHKALGSRPACQISPSSMPSSASSPSPAAGSGPRRRG